MASKVLVCAAFKIVALSFRKLSRRAWELSAAKCGNPASCSATSLA